MRRYEWEQVAKTHLKAPLEFIDLHFMVEGVTRSFTHQMVRQRTAVYGQESMRFAVKGNLSDEIDLPPTMRDKSQQADLWRETIAKIEEAYNSLVANGIPAEDARGLLPHATRTRLHYKTNLRNILDTMGNRLCTQAQFEWRMVVAGIVEAIRDFSSPHYEYERSDGWQWRLIADGTFKPVCYTLGHCPFQGDIDRPCSIRERVQEGKFDEIDPREWLLDVNAAR
jgi:flavin-dependent thymidylate synthase